MRLVKGGATPRILDLHSIHVRAHRYLEHASQPMFWSSRLNQSFLIKHTVRPQERSYLETENAVVTKIIIPISATDLSAGGHSFIVEQCGFATRLRDFLGSARTGPPDYDDLDRLRELAAIPSFDPFLLAERFRRHKHPVSMLYFDINPGETERMEAFVGDQIGAVVKLALNCQDDTTISIRARKLAREILSGEDSERMNLLRIALQMTEDEFQDGLYGWKGVLYYKWKVDALRADLENFIYDMRNLEVRSVTPGELVHLNEMRRAIFKETRRRWQSLCGLLGRYDSEFEAFASGRDLLAIQRFLLQAPDYFETLGADLSAVSHVTSYWSHASSEEEVVSLPRREAFEFFSSFLRSLARDGNLPKLSRRPAIERRKTPRGSGPHPPRTAAG
ncbi:hypothetical protein [Maricaulis sp. CAU 1757]